MAKILINGFNSKVGGGKSILLNYISLLENSFSSHEYFLLLPASYSRESFINWKLKIVNIPLIFHNQIGSFFLYNFYFKSVFRKLDIDLVFNLADIPIKTEIKQMFLFDWPYAIYPDSKVWSLMDFKSLITRKIKLKIFEQNFKYIDLLIAQTETSEKRLRQLYGFKNVVIVPNAVSLENFKVDIVKNTERGLIKLLCLTHYYPHKNLEIFLDLAQKIKNFKLNFQIIITIDSSQHKNAKKLLNNIRIRNLGDVIINIGPVAFEGVPDLYKKCHGLILPTLLESFSGTYVEAMFHEIPIFTSDMDFAKEVCKDAGTYFDPFDADSILLSLNEVYSDEELKNKKIQRGRQIIHQFPDWNKSFCLINNNMETLLNN
jgi:glycosyltransferase involved in cell wall biosynthesis